MGARARATPHPSPSSVSQVVVEDSRLITKHGLSPPLITLISRKQHSFPHTQTATTTLPLFHGRGRGRSNGVGVVVGKSGCGVVVGGTVWLWVGLWL